MFRTGGIETSSPEHRSPSRGDEKETITTRPSRGLEQFFTQIRDQMGLSILDLSGATQENVNFITNLGHKIYSQDFLRSLDDTFAGEDPTEQANPGLIERFLRQNLDFPEETFDGVLLWDVLQYMSPALLAATLDQLARIVRPKAYLLAFFNADEKASSVMSYTFRIQDKSTLLLVSRGYRKQGLVFNNRSLEKLFGRFESLKFFLTKEHLREIIVRR